jgi:hypothetical protein
MTIKDIITLDPVEYPDTEILREDFADISEGQWNFLQALLTCRKDPRPWEDFYIFEDIITALNYEVPDFSALEPPNTEQLYHGIALMETMAPRLPFSFEVRTYARRVFNDGGVYIYPESIDGSEDNKVMLKQVEDKIKSGPFPLKDDDVVDIQASHLMAMKLYHGIESGKNVDFLAKELEIA